MKKYKFLSLSVLVAFGTFVSSCDRVDYGDLNSQQIQTEKGDPEALLRGAMARYFTLGGRDYLANATNYAQYQTQLVYTSESRYADTEGFWDQYYAVILPGLKLAAEVTYSPKGNTANLNATADLFSLLVWQRVTDTFGDIPYTQALQGVGNLTPGYSKQEDIYKDIILRAKSDRDRFDTSAFLLSGSADIVFQGSISKWKKFANSFIMSVAVKLSKKYPAAGGYAATEFNAALTNAAGVMTTNADNMVFTYDVANAVSNPFSGLRGADYSASRQFTDALKGTVSSFNPTSNHTADGRRVKYLTSSTTNGIPYGYATTSGSGNRLNSTNVRAAAAPRYEFTAAYTYLNRAEAATLGWTSESATAMLDMGINTSFTQWAAIGGPAYSTARLTDASTPALLKQVIGEEKWVALFPNGYAAWTEWRRTGYPNLLPAPDYLNSGVIPGRVRYPATELTLNNVSYNGGVSTLLPAVDKNSSKLWWAQ